MTARRSLSILMVVTATAMAACSDATGPESRADANGAWAGSMTHPSYDGGALSFNLTDANGAVEGTYRLILSKRVGGRVAVEQSGGRVSGSSANGRLTLRMERSGGDEWLLEARLDGSRATGEWSTEHRVRGTFEVTRGTGR
jgi:hypothetical protein